MNETLVWSVVLAVSVIVLAFGVRRGLRPPSTGPVVPPPLHADEDVRAEVTELVRSGQTIRAIKRLREGTGLGLAEAKTAVEHWDPETSARREERPDLTALDVEIRAAAAGQGMIAAVKLARERTGWSLLEAKTYVDRLVG